MSSTPMPGSNRSDGERRRPGWSCPDPDLTRLDGEELALVQFAAQWPKTVEAAAASREPHRIAFYLNDLAAAFHSLWNRGNDDPARRFLIEDDLPLTAARLALANGVAQVVANGLGVMGVAPAEEML